MEWNEYIGIIADVLSLLGIGGLLSWSFFNREKPLGNRILVIFKYSIRFSIAITASFLFIIVGGSIYSLSTMFSGVQDADGFEYIFRYVVQGTGLLFLVPFYLVTFISIISASLDPINKVIVNLFKNE